MADSFAELWNSSAPPSNNNNKTAPPTLTQRRPQQKQDVFSLLSSAAAASNPASRSITPAAAASPSQRSLTPNPIKSKGDAFGDLLTASSFTSAAGAAKAANMTIAERAAEVERMKLEKLRGQSTTIKSPTTGGGAWAGLDTLEHPKPRSSNNNDHDWGLDDFISNPEKPTKKPPQPIADDNNHNHDWLSDFSSPPPPAAAVAPAVESLDDFNFDHHEGEDTLLTHDDDDILGALGKPVRDDATATKKPRSRTNTNTNSTNGNGNGNGNTNTNPSRPQSSSQSSSQSRPSSPPPHILGKIVEMGFSIPQARLALAATDSGIDVESALEILLSSGVNGGVGDAGDAGGSTVGDDDDSPPTMRSGSRLMMVNQDDRNGTRSRRRRRDTNTGTSTPSTQQDQDQTTAPTPIPVDKLLSQASEFGMSVFTKASSFWKEGKERVQRVVAERAVVAGGVGSLTTTTTTTTTGVGVGGAQKPRWMVQEHEGEVSPVSPISGAATAGRFVDGDHDDDVAVGGESSKQKKEPRQQRLENDNKPILGDLFSDDGAAAAAATYVSPFRRRGGAAASTSASSRQSTTPQQKPKPQPPPPPPRLTRPTRPRRPLITAPLPTLTLSNSHKSTATSHFHLGQFSSAISSYTSAISLLPAGHLLLVPLYNNRALARLKVGELDGVLEDVGVVLGIIGEEGEWGVEGGGEGDDDSMEQQGKEVRLGDAYLKALKRRAEALEGKEKWEDAARNWGRICGLDWVSGKVRGDAARGLGRCRRMMVGGGGGGGGGVPTTSRSSLELESKPKPKPKPQLATTTTTPAPPTTPSQALKNLRKATTAAEAEDQARHELKDSVDARLQAWKGGKETNVRALLGSLDTVLWAEFFGTGSGTGSGMKKVGMAELITPAQVKVGYMRVIARLHPDKLNATNTTVEQRMIANGVFGALNEAWNAFKQ